jgi:hypothetical protein
MAPVYLIICSLRRVHGNHRSQNKTTNAAFINFPYQLYQKDPIWVAPLRSEQTGQYVPEKNPMLNHCTYQLFLAIKDGKVAGRISAFIDHLAVEHWKQPIGLFGSFECIEDVKWLTLYWRG